MTHIFDGQLDGRQADEEIAPTRFRPRYRPLSDGEKELHDAIKAAAAHLEHLYKQIYMVQAAVGRPAFAREVGGLPVAAPSRYLAIATTDLESSVMWAVKALTS